MHLAAWLVAACVIGWTAGGTLNSWLKRRKDGAEAMKRRTQLRCVMQMLAEGTDHLHVDGMVTALTPHGLHLALTTLLQEGDLTTVDLLSVPPTEHKRLIRAAAQQWVAFEDQRARPQ